MLKIMFVLMVVVLALVGCKRADVQEAPVVGTPVTVVDAGTADLAPIPVPVVVDAGATPDAAVPAAVPDAAPVAPAADAVVLVAPATATVAPNASGG